MSVCERLLLLLLLEEEEEEEEAHCELVACRQRDTLQCLMNVHMRCVECELTPNINGCPHRKAIEHHLPVLWAALTNIACATRRRVASGDLPTRDEALDWPARRRWRSCRRWWWRRERTRGCDDIVARRCSKAVNDDKVGTRGE